jgi:butyryl-CoA dehydrogenase
MGGALRENPEAAIAGSAPYLRLFSLATGGAYVARGALAASRNGAAGEIRVATARFFAENIAVAAPGLAATVMGGAESVLAVSPACLSA